MGIKNNEHSETVSCRNTEQDFDHAIEQALGNYVYALLDPTASREVFYIGKGGGSGKGNQRVLSHLREAEQALSVPEHKKSDKVARIHKIWRAGQKVEWTILRYALPSSEVAFSVEAAFIDYFGLENLTNEQRGHDSVGSGRLQSAEVYLLGAPVVAPTSDYPAVLLFNIQNGLRKGRSVYDATRGWWRHTRPWEAKATHAVGLVQGVSRCVIKIEGWQSWGEAMSEAGHSNAPDYLQDKNSWNEIKDVRRGCFGQSFTERDGHELLFKNFRHILDQTGWWNLGNWLVVQFTNGQATLIRPRAKPAKS